MSEYTIYIIINWNQKFRHSDIMICLSGVLILLYYVWYAVTCLNSNVWWWKWHYSWSSMALLMWISGRGIFMWYVCNVWKWGAAWRPSITQQPVAMVNQLSANVFFTNMWWPTNLLPCLGAFRLPDAISGLCLLCHATNVAGILAPCGVFCAKKPSRNSENNNQWQTYWREGEKCQKLIQL